MERFRDPVQLIQALVQRFTRYHVSYHGVVVDANDPMTRGRVKVRVDELGWSTPALAAWCWPRGIHRMSVPPVGSRVEVAFIGGDRDRPVYVGLSADILDQRPPTQYSSPSTRVLFEDPETGDYVLYDAQARELSSKVGSVIVKATSTAVEVSGFATLKLGAGTEAYALGTTLATWIASLVIWANAHTHGGPTGVPTLTGPGTITSTKITGE